MASIAAPAQADELALRNEIDQYLLSLLRATLAGCLIANFLLGIADFLFEEVHHPRIGALRFALIGAVVALWKYTYARQAVRRAIPLCLLALALICVQIVGPAVMHGDLSSPVVLSIALVAAASTAAPWGVGGQLAAIAVTTLTTIGTMALGTGELHVALYAYPKAAAALVCGMSLYAAIVCRRIHLLSLQRGVALVGSAKILEAREEALARLNADLERRVQERTAQLEAANTRLEQESVERQQATEALRRNQRQLRDILDNTTAVIYLKDTAGRYLLINSQYENLFHVTRAQVVGQTDYDLFPQAAADAFRTNDRRVLVANHAISFEETVPQDDGNHTYVSVKFPLRDEHGMAYGVCGISTDITDLKRAETRILEHQAELSHVLRVHTIGEMAAGLAHEINQPLAAISNYARGCGNWIRSGDAPPGELLSAQEEIARQALRAGEIIRHLRSMVEKRAPTRETTELNAVVTEAARVVAGEIRQQGVTLSLDLASGLPPIQMDPIQIEQVIVNLLLNSLEAMREVNGRTHRVIVRTAQDCTHALEVVVQDTGSGLTPTVSEKMFDPFFTLKRSGLGMGLTISRSIVEGHGGRIWATNNPDGGAQVHVVLPSTTAEPAPGG